MRNVVTQTFHHILVQHDHLLGSFQIPKRDIQDYMFFTYVILFNIILYYITILLSSLFIRNNNNNINIL